MRWIACSLLFCLFSTTINLIAQPRRICHTGENMERLMEKHPDYKIKLDAIDKYSELKAKSSLMRLNREQVVIPVVVHVVYNNETQNISEAQIRAQIQVLNEDFGGRNSNWNQVPSRFKASASSNTFIQFKLAQRDPNGNPTNGITRTRAGKYSYSSYENDVKSKRTGGVDPWPTHQYLNIWVCNLSMGVLGYSQFPGGPVKTDGVVIGYKYFGRGQRNLIPPFNRGRTATHEIGHWLNLRHIWGDGPCGTDDLVSDTHMAQGPNQGRARENYSCGSWDMTSNFMDYTDDAYMNFFTEGQARRMYNLFMEGGARRGLLSSPALLKDEPPVVEAESPSNPPPILQPQRPTYEPRPQAPSGNTNLPMDKLSPPEKIAVTSLLKDKVSLSWTPVSGAEKYYVRFRPKGTNNWKARNILYTSVDIPGLNACSAYDFQVKSIKNGVGSDTYASLPGIKTTGCLIKAPRGLEHVNVSRTYVTFSWKPIQGIKRYHIQYRDARTKKVRNEYVQGTQVTIKDLKPGEYYHYRVRAIATYDDKTTFSTPRVFKTKTSRFSSIYSIARLWPGMEDGLKIDEDPGGEYLYLSHDEMNGKSVDMRLVDVKSMTAITKKATFHNGRPIQLAVGHLPAGVYNLQLSSREGYNQEKEIWIGNSW